ncbi:hypothetical protein DPV78_000254 [Talaromyces pinophilus]|nr:hypothetical protein DPV78_000254 [Talaromyces pinophilus]
MMAKFLSSLGRATFAAVSFVIAFSSTIITADAAVAGPGSVLVPSIPSPIAQSNNYTVKVRSEGDKQWQSVDLYWTRVMVANVTTGAGIYHNSSVGIFDFDGVIDISIEPRQDLFPSIDSVRIRPLSYDIPWTLNGRTIQLTLSEPTNLVVEVNGDVFQVLHLFLNKIDTGDPQQEKNGTVTSFSPGYHHLNQTYKISSGETVYLAPGAVVKGSFLFLNVENARLIGHGIIYGSSLNAVNVSFSNNILVDGPTVLSPLHASVGVGSSHDILIRNLRVISSGQWGDGIDTWCSQNITYEKLFMRTGDDSLAFYLSSSPYSGDSQNITIRDSSVWADVAHPLNVGGFGGNETMSDLTFDNIDILDQHEPQIYYQGCMAMSASNGNIVKNVLFNNIRVENFRLGMLFSFKVAYNPKYDSTAGGTLSNITVRDVEYNGSDSNISIMSGYDKNSLIEFVNFEGLRINGQLIWSGMQKAPCRGAVSNYSLFSYDAKAAWQNALMWYITKDQAHWERSTTILDAWGSNLTNIIGTDRSLLIGLEGDLFVNAAEIMRWEGNWTEATSAWWGGSGFSIQLYWLFSRQSIPIGQANYGMVSIEALLSFAVCLEDVQLYNYAMDAFIQDNCAGLFATYDSRTGQSIEAGRDQSHTMSGLGWAAYGARVGQSQGVDLYGLGNNLLLKGAEYAAQYNLKETVEYEPNWRRCESVLVDGPWSTISASNRGVTNQRRSGTSYTTNMWLIAS